MVLISKTFPSRFLRGDEIVGHEVNVTISAVKLEKARNNQTQKDEEVYVLYFKDKDRGVILKKQRAQDVCMLTGSDDTDKWVGQTVCIYTEKKSAFGKIQNLIRFKEAAPLTVTNDNQSSLD